MNQENLPIGTIFRIANKKVSYNKFRPYTSYQVMEGSLQFDYTYQEYKMSDDCKVKKTKWVFKHNVVKARNDFHKTKKYDMVKIYDLEPDNRYKFVKIPILDRYIDEFNIVHRTRTFRHLDDYELD